MRTYTKFAQVKSVATSSLACPKVLSRGAAQTGVSIDSSSWSSVSKEERKKEKKDI